MADHDSRRVVIEFSLTHDAPCGTLRAPGGAAMPFAGWLQLLAQLQRFVGESEHEPAADAGRRVPGG